MPSKLGLFTTIFIASIGALTVLTALLSAIAYL